MIRWLWDLLFTRKQWTVIRKVNCYVGEDAKMPTYEIWVLQDQWGNIKQKRIGL